MKEMTQIDSYALVLCSVLSGVLGNFVSQTLHCETRKLLHENIYAKHFVLFFLIVVALDASIRLRPWKLLAYACILYAVLLMMLKMGATFAKLFAMFLAFGYLLDMISADLMGIDRAMTFNAWLTLIVLLLASNTLYEFVRQRDKYKQNFSWSKFLLGTVACRHMSKFKHLE